MADRSFSLRLAQRGRLAPLDSPGKGYAPAPHTHLQLIRSRNVLSGLTGYAFAALAICGLYWPSGLMC